jgi:SAM-dependent methyltransferase
MRHYRHLLFALSFTMMAGQPLSAGQSAKTDARYEFREEHDRDGIGKFYMGREISHVMGHLGAGWLERPERTTEERPDLLIESFNAQPGQVIADIGAGTGYFSLPLAELVGPAGKILAVDIQQPMLDKLKFRMKKRNATNIELILGKEDDPNLPGCAVDMAFMVDVYHEFNFPYEMVAKLCDALKTGGRLIFVEYRAEDPDVPIKPLHKMTQKQVIKEMAPHPLRHVETLDLLPRQHVIIFEKTKECSPPGATPNP